MISIIVLTHNSLKYIQACLDSIYSQDVSGIEIIVIDNGSKDHTPEFIKTNYTQVNVIENANNLGSCKARNYGIEISKGEWILTLDSDVVLKNNFLKEFIIAENKFSKDVGMVQPNILNPDRKTIYSRGIYLSFLRRFYDFGRNKPITFHSGNSKNIIGSCSASAFYHRSMLEEIKEKTGYFDERFFFLVEDVDLAWRAKLAKWRVAYLPRAICFHKGNGSATSYKHRQYLCFRNRYLMINKNDKLLNKIFLLLFSFIYEIPIYLYLICTNKYLATKFMKI